MKPKDAETKPSFQVGDQARLNRYITPILSGSIVAIQQVGKGGRRYLVKSTEYQAAPVWVDAIDLDWVIA